MKEQGLIPDDKIEKRVFFIVDEGILVYFRTNRAKEPYPKIVSGNRIVRDLMAVLE